MPRQPSALSPLTVGPGGATTPDVYVHREGTGTAATEWPRATVTEPAGRWISARVRVIDETILVMDREGERRWVYELDAPPILDTSAPSPRLVGKVDGNEIAVEVFGGCACETTTWIGAE